MFIQVKKHPQTELPMMLNVSHIVQVRPVILRGTPARERNEDPRDPNGSEITLSNGVKLEVDDLYEEVCAKILKVVG